MLYGRVNYTGEDPRQRKVHGFGASWLSMFLTRKFNQLVLPFCCPTAQWFGACNAVLASSLPTCGLPSLGSLVFTCLSCALWRSVCKLHPAFPFFRVTRSAGFICQGHEIFLLHSGARSVSVLLVCHPSASQSGHLQWQRLGGFDSGIERLLSVP